MTRVFACAAAAAALMATGASPARAAVIGFEGPGTIGTADTAGQFGPFQTYATPSAIVSEAGLGSVLSVGKNDFGRAVLWLVGDVKLESVRIFAEQTVVIHMISAATWDEKEFVHAAGGGWRWQDLATGFVPSVITFSSDGAFRVDDLEYVAAVSSAPEPVLWATMVAGFALVGGSLRRRATVSG